MVEDALSEEILLGKIRLGDRVRVIESEGQLSFEPLARVEQRELVAAGQPNSD